MSSATIIHLRALLLRWMPRLSADDIDLHVRRLRELDLLPIGTGGGNGSAAARVETKDAIVLLLALLSGEAPKAAASRVREIAAYRHIATRAHEQSQDMTVRAGLSLDHHNAVRPYGLGAMLVRIVDGIRSNTMGGFRPFGVVVGDTCGSPVAVVQIAAVEPVGASGARVGYDFLYAPPGADSAERADSLPQLEGASVESERLSRTLRIGGTFLMDLAALLGPIAATGGGGPVKSIGELHDDAAPPWLPIASIAALGAVAPASSALQ